MPPDPSRSSCPRRLLTEPPLCKTWIRPSSVTENQEEIKQNMAPVADHDHNVTGVTFVDNSEVAVVAVCKMTYLPVQEDEYDADSERDREDDTPPDITVIRSGRAFRARFHLDL